jgi:hypothetical protein
MKPDLAPSFTSAQRAPRLPLGMVALRRFLRTPTKFHVGVRRECRKNDCDCKLVAIMVIEGGGYFEQRQITARRRSAPFDRSGSGQAEERARLFPVGRNDDGLV